MSIAAQDLRIGNWVKIGSGNAFVCAIGELAAHTAHGLHTYEFIAPIPLTKEVLIACGFIDWSDYKGQKDKLTDVLIEEDWIRFVINPTWGEEGAYRCDMELELEENGAYSVDHHGVEVKYLHQLQNLYFSLTGQELVYNPEVKK